MPSTNAGPPTPHVEWPPPRGRAAYGPTPKPARTPGNTLSIVLLVVGVLVVFLGSWAIGLSTLNCDASPALCRHDAVVKPWSVAAVVLAAISTLAQIVITQSWPRLVLLGRGVRTLAMLAIVATVIGVWQLY